MAVPSISQDKKAHKPGEKIKAELIQRSEAKIKLGQLAYRLPIFLVFFIFFGILILSFFYIPNTGVNLVPYSLHSYLTANYSADPHDLIMPVLDFELVREYIRDQEAIDPDGLYQALKISLQTPVATVTQLYALTATPTTTTIDLTSTVPVENYPPAPTLGLPDNTPTVYVTLPPNGTPPWESTPGSTRSPTSTPNSSRPTATKTFHPTSQATKPPATATQNKPTATKTSAPPSSTQPKPTASKTPVPPTQAPPPTKPPDPYPPPPGPNPTPPPPYP